EDPPREVPGAGPERQGSRHGEGDPAAAQMTTDGIAVILRREASKDSRRRNTKGGIAALLFCPKTRARLRACRPLDPSLSFRMTAKKFAGVGAGLDPAP